MPEKTKIIFSFDTEDYVNEAAADGILRTAQLLTDEGVTGCFQIVALLAEALVKWGRQDVIDALKKHEIDFHSFSHSMHPTINEYTDMCNFDAALEEFLRRERVGMKMVKDVFGVDHFASAVPPGSSISYVARYGYAAEGIPVYAANQNLDVVSRRPVSYCNSTYINYSCGMDRLLFDTDEEALRKRLDEKAAKSDVYVFYHHPAMNTVKVFADELNFFKKNTPPEKYVLSETYTKEETDRFFANFRTLIRLLKADGRFEFTTFGEIGKENSAPRAVHASAIRHKIRPQIEELFFPVTFPDSYCLADLFRACATILKGQLIHECGEVRGFLAEPYAIKESMEVSPADVVASALSIPQTGFLPELVWVGDRAIGPADWLRAALRVIAGESKIRLEPAPWQIDLDQFPALRDQTLKGVWIHSDEFEDRWLSDRARLQSWTLRLPKGTKRTIL